MFSTYCEAAVLVLATLSPELPTMVRNLSNYFVLLLLIQMMEVQKASAGSLMQGVGIDAKYLYVVHKGTVSVTSTALQGGWLSSKIRGSLPRCFSISESMSLIIGCCVIVMEGILSASLSLPPTSFLRRQAESLYVSH